MHKHLEFLTQRLCLKQEILDYHVEGSQICKQELYFCEEKRLLACKISCI